MRAGTAEAADTTGTSGVSRGLGRTAGAGGAGRAGGAGVVELALCALATVAVGLVYSGFFAGTDHQVPLAGAAVAPAVLVGLTARRGWPAGPTTVLLAVAFIAFALYAPLVGVAGGGAPDGEAWRQLGRGLTDGWARMLSVGLPADPAPDVLLTPVAIAWLASSVASLLATRTSVALAPLVPPVGGFALALAFVATRDRAQLVPTGAVLAAGLLLALVRTNRIATAGIESAAAAAPPSVAGAGDPGGPTTPGPANGNGAGPGRHPGPGTGRGARSRPPAGRLAFGLPIVALVATAGSLAAGFVPAGRDRFDPRELRHERLSIDDTLSPLVRLKAQLRAERPDELFRVEVDGPLDGVDRVRTAALESYDGALWSSAGEYLRAGGELTADGPAISEGRVERLRLTVTLAGLEGPFLPTVGRPVTLDTTEEVGFDSASGNLVASRRRLAGVRYQVEGDVAVLEDSELLAARASTGPAFDALRTPPPDVPELLRSTALTWAGESDTWMGELLAIRDRLHGIRYDDSPAAEPGHSYGALLRVLAGEDSERAGYAEQFASAFALLTRERGFATRLAVGYRLPEPDADGGYTITEAQAHAWPEVAIDGYGWVAIEPTDVSRIDAPDTGPDDPPDQPGDTPSVGEQAATEEPRDVVADPQGPAAGGGAGSVVATGGRALLALGLLVLVVPRLAKAQRRRRRRRARRPSARVMGAWHETVDRLTEQGLPVPDSHTAAEVAQQAATRFNGAATEVRRLVPLVAAALYAPGEPGEAVARAAWKFEREVRTAVLRGTGVRGRLRAWLDPRPLLSGRRNRRRRSRVGNGR